MLKHTLHKKTYKKAIYRYAGGSGGGGGGTTVGPSATNKNWSVDLVWEHWPGFFSCDRFKGQTLLGTYETCLGFKAQLCHLETQSVLHTFSSSESVYHIRAYADHCYLPCEQGELWKLNDPLGTPIHIESQGLGMGYYDALDMEGYRYSIQKEAVGPSNHVIIHRNGATWYDTTHWYGKDMHAVGPYLYVSGAVGRRAAIIRIDRATKSTHYTYPPTGNWCVTPALFDDKIWVAVQDGRAAYVYNTSGRKYALSGKTGWMTKTVSGMLFASSTATEWRGDGPSYLYYFDKNSDRFVLIAKFKDAEPWDICPGRDNKEFVFVTRNNNEHCGLGRVYRLRYVLNNPFPLDTV